MSDYAIMVDFRLVPGKRTEFRRLIDLNARLSSANEPGCRRFDVLEAEGEPDRVLLYELYADEDAFGAHLRSEHYRAFDRDSAPLVVGKTVTRCRLVAGGRET